MRARVRMRVRIRALCPTWQGNGPGTKDTDCDNPLSAKPSLQLIGAGDELN